MRRTFPVFLVCALAGLALASLGCPPTDYGKKCRFTGDDETACGRCIARSCQPYVDQCCASTYGCEPELAALDACASGQGCSALAAKSSESAGSEIRALAQCALASCSSACGGGDAGARVDVRALSCASETDYCTCEVVGYRISGTAAEVRCPNIEMSGGVSSSKSVVCCASSEGWSTVTGGSCYCTAYATGTGGCSSSEVRVSFCR